jgi:hypothetical protein
MQCDHACGLCVQHMAQLWCCDVRRLKAEALSQTEESLWVVGLPDRQQEGEVGSLAHSLGAHVLHPVPGKDHHLLVSATPAAIAALLAAGKQLTAVSCWAGWCKCCCDARMSERWQQVRRAAGVRTDARTCMPHLAHILQAPMPHFFKLSASLEALLDSTRALCYQMLSSSARKSSWPILRRWAASTLC